MVCVFWKCVINVEWWADLGHLCRGVRKVWRRCMSVGVRMWVLASPSCSKLAKLILSLAVVWCHLLVLMCFYGCSLMPTMADGKHSFFFLFWDRVSCSSGWPQTSSVVEGYLNSAPSLAFRLSVWDHRHVLPCPAVWCSDSGILSPSIPTSMGKAVIAVT